ncbi:MAG: CoA transferase [Cytophagia bacterium]|nr:CoA transferase [Cytophagia bacterium]
MKTLDDIKVVDFSHLLPGPLASKMLAQMGAKVTKVERPDRKDGLRYFPPMDGDTSWVFKNMNRNKDIKFIAYNTDRGRTKVLELIGEADIVIEQFRPGAMASWKLSYDHIRTVKPDIIYVSITGYGQTGPYANHAGHDINYLGYSGILSLITGQKNRPVIPGVQIADIVGGTYPALIAILSALYHRRRTGVGQYLDIAMLEHILPMLNIPYAQHQASEDSQYPSFLSGQIVNYNIYQCADDKWMALGALEVKFWNAFCQSVQKHEWERDNLDALYVDVFPFHEVEVLFKSKSQAEWTAHSLQHDFCLSPVLGLDEISIDRHLMHKDWINELFSK